MCYLLNACTSQPIQEPITPIKNVGNLQELSENINKPFIYYPSPNNYSVCHGHTCSEFSFVQLSNMQWQAVKDLFSPTANNAQQEREQIKLAIALLERLTGEQSDTHKDQAENFTDNGLNGQLDCIDEATNSTVYLRMLDDAGLLNFHQQASRTSRGGFFSPHNTATIIEIESNSRYAVDSWFDDNGRPPAIVPLSQWKKGWKPGLN
jgi:hypothetical protein